MTAGPSGTYGYQDGTDKLDISAWGVGNIDDVFISSNANGDAVIENTFGGDSITLVGVNSSVLDASDFIFASATALAA